MDFDSILKNIGEFGRYQKKSYCLLNTMYVFQCCQVLLLVFIGDKPSWHCAEREQSFLDEAKKAQGFPCYKDGSVCQHVTFNEEFTSIATEWKLICDQEFKANLGQSVMMAGCFIGVIISGRIADILGRKWVIIGSNMAGFTFGIATQFVQSYNQFLVVRFLCGLSIIGAGLSLFVLLTEIIGPTYRGPALTFSSVFFSFGFGILAWLANMFREWRQLCIAAALPGLLYTLFSLNKFHESPRWLLAKGRTAEAEIILKKIARANGTTFINYDHTAKSLNGSSSQHSGTSVGILSLFRYKTIRMKMILLTLIWLVVTLVYYGLSFNMKNIKGDRYWNFFLSGMVEIPSYLLATPLVNNIGRRRSYFLSIMLGAFGCLVCAVGPSDYESLSVMVGKFGISAAFAIVYVYTAELIPTVVRNFAMGYCSMMARVGGILALVLLHCPALTKSYP